MLGVGDTAVPPPLHCEVQRVPTQPCCHRGQEWGTELPPPPQHRERRKRKSEGESETLQFQFFSLCKSW